MVYNFLQKLVKRQFREYRLSDSHTFTFGRELTSTRTFHISLPNLIKFDTEDLQVRAILSFERIDAVNKTSPLF